jgi:hypothetical protein
MLTQLAAVHESIEESGGAVIGIAPAASFQAEYLMAGTVPFDLLLDPGQRVSQRIGVHKQSLAHFIFDVSAWWRYLTAFFSGHRQRRITGHYSNVPAVCVVNADAEVTYVYTGTGIGDYPPLQNVLDALEAATSL